MEKMNFFSKNLRTWLFAHEKTNAQLGEALGITGTAVGKWINENRVPPRMALRSVCSYINIDPGEFVEKDMTYEIIKASNYTDTIMVGEPAEGKYMENATIKMLTRHIEETQEQLKLIEQAGERVLQSAKNR